MLGSDINNLWSADDLCKSSDSFLLQAEFAQDGYLELNLMAIKLK